MISGERTTLPILEYLNPKFRLHQTHDCDTQGLQTTKACNILSALAVGNFSFTGAYLTTVIVELGGPRTIETCGQKSRDHFSAVAYPQLVHVRGTEN